jgi:phage tail-like protein
MSDRTDITLSEPEITRFRVTWGTQAPSVFREASGIGQDTTTVLNRRAAAGPQQPVDVVAGQVTFRNGLVAVDDRLWQWYRAATADAVNRSIVLIDLIDDAGTPFKTWMMKNAWPASLVAANASVAGAFAVESIAFAFESLEVTSG